MRVPVDEYIDALGLRIDPHAPARATVAQVLAALRQLGWDYDVEVFTPYAEAAERLSVYDLESIPAGIHPAEATTTLVARTVLFEVAFAALRAMVQEHGSATLPANTRWSVHRGSSPLDRGDRGEPRGRLR